MRFITFSHFGDAFLRRWTWRSTSGWWVARRWKVRGAGCSEFRLLAGHGLRHGCPPGFHSKNVESLKPGMVDALQGESCGVSELARISGVGYLWYPVIFRWTRAQVKTPSDFFLDRSHQAIIVWNSKSHFPPEMIRIPEKLPPQASCYVKETAEILALPCLASPRYWSIATSRGRRENYWASGCATCRACGSQRLRFFLDIRWHEMTYQWIDLRMRGNHDCWNISLQIDGRNMQELLKKGMVQFWGAVGTDIWGWISIGIQRLCLLVVCVAFSIAWLLTNWKLFWKQGSVPSTPFQCLDDRLLRGAWKAMLKHCQWMFVERREQHQCFRENQPRVFLQIGHPYTIGVLFRIDFVVGSPFPHWEPGLGPSRHCKACDCAVQIRTKLHRHTSHYPLVI